MVVNGEEQGEEILKEFGIDMCMLWYLKWIMNKVIKYSIGNFVQSYVAAWMGGELGENGYMYIYVCVCVCVCVYGWGPLISTWNDHNIVNWLYANIK